jgi:ribosomal protein S20
MDVKSDPESSAATSTATANAKAFDNDSQKKDQFILYKAGARVSAPWYSFDSKFFLDGKLYPATITGVTRTSIGEAIAVSLLYDDQCTREVSVDELRPLASASKSEEAPINAAKSVISDVKSIPQTAESDLKKEDELNKSADATANVKATEVQIATKNKEQIIEYNTGARVAARWHGFSGKLYPATITGVTRNSVGEPVVVSLLYDDQCTREVAVDELRPVESASKAEETPTKPAKAADTAVISDAKSIPQTAESDSKKEDELNKSPEPTESPAPDANKCTSDWTEAPADTDGIVPTTPTAQTGPTAPTAQTGPTASTAATDDQRSLTTDGQLEADTKADEKEEEEDEEGEEEEEEEEAKDAAQEEEGADDKERRNCCCACQPLRVATDRLLWMTVAFMLMWAVLSMSLAANNRQLTNGRLLAQENIPNLSPIQSTVKVDDGQLLQFRADLLSTISGGLTAAATVITKQCTPQITAIPPNSCGETFARHFDFPIKSRGTSFTTALQVGDYIHTPDCKKIVILQDDCNFVMYDSQKKPLWATNTRNLATECNAFIMCSKDLFCSVCVGSMKSDGQLSGSCPHRRYRGKWNGAPAFGFHQGDATSFL